jgi:hypothetical protein
MTQGVGRVMVRGHKIDRHVALLTELEKLFNPSIARRRRSADFQRWVNLLDGVRSDPIQLEILLLGASPKGLQIRFVPHFKEPFRHFLDAVQVDPMRNERLDQGRPLFVILWGRHVAAVMEDGLRSGRERCRHKTQFDERPHANRQKEVDDLIGVEKGIQQLIVVCDGRSDIIRQQPVKAHVAKSQFGPGAAKLLLPVGSERDRRMAAADGVLPAVQKLSPLLRKIAPEIYRSH